MKNIAEMTEKEMLQELVTASRAQFNGGLDGGLANTSGANAQPTPAKVIRPAAKPTLQMIPETGDNLVNTFPPGSTIPIPRPKIRVDLNNTLVRMMQRGRLDSTCYNPATVEDEMLAYAYQQPVQVRTGENMNRLVSELGPKYRDFCDVELTHEWDLFKVGNTRDGEPIFPAPDGYKEP